jgi:tetratricopeptide (TPR) repeat protein
MAARKKSGWRKPVALAVALVLPMAAFAVTDADRIAVYRDFRAQFDARKYAEAQPLAERLVALTEEQYGADELPLTNPLTNLATVHYKLGHYPAAIENYQRTLRILQAKSTLADKQQIRPLHGLGVSFLGARDAESAVIALKRAADLSRNTDGLFNINQVEFIDALIDAYEASGRYAEAEKESLYAMRVEEAAYGRNSIKLLSRLDKLARWYEGARRYTSERNTYERSLGILARSAPENDIRRVGPLRGIARAFRLEAFYGVEGADTGSTFNSGPSGAPTFADGTQQRRGEASLNLALAVIAANNPVNERLRGHVLTDLGDWYLVTNAVRRAYDTYAEAWKALAIASDTAILETPRILAYRPSISSVERSQVDPAEAEVKVVELHCKVDRDGRVDEVTSPTTDVPEAIVRNSVASMRRSRYAPRIENGIAVPTEKVIFLERVLVRVTPTDSATSSAKAEEKPEEKAPEVKKEEPVP